MLSAVLQPEIDTLQSQIAQLQAQIAQAEQRISHLNEAESIAEKAIQSLQSAVLTVSTLAPEAIANLKTAVLNLFNGEESNCRLLPDMEAEKETVTSSEQMDHQTHIDLINSSDDPLSDDPLSDVPEVEQSFVELIQVNNAIAYQRKRDGEIVCIYAGFNNKTRAKQWGEWLAVHHSVASGFEVREAKRLNDFKHELKLWSMSLKQIERLADCDLTKSPPSNYGTAPKRQPEGAPPATPLTTIEDVAVGDVVRSRTVKFWEYRVLEIRADGLLNCEKLGVTPAIRLALHPSSIELVSKADVIETVSKELEEHLESQAEEAIASIQLPSYNPYPIGWKGAAANWEAFQASGKKLHLKGDPMEKWRELEQQQKAEREKLVSQQTESELEAAA